jgi:hypothetical protein
VSSQNIASKADTALEGGITQTDIKGGLSEQMSKLLDAAMLNDEDAREAERLVEKYSTTKHKAAVAAHEFVYAMVPYRGFGPSKMGANILLERVKKLKTLAGAEYAKQRIADEMHTKIATSLLQISEALDCSDKQRGAALLADASDKLVKLVGPDKASETLRMMSDWSKGLNVTADKFTQSPWDVATLHQNVGNATSLAVQSDPVFENVVEKLKKFNRSKAMSAVGTAVEVASSAGELLAPGFAIPVGVDAAQALFVTCTGGTEETKMMNEMWYAKKMESRWKRLREESEMSLAAYEQALQKKQPTLLACSESILNDLVGSDKTKRLLGQSILTATPPKDKDKSQDLQVQAPQLGSTPGSN